MPDPHRLERELRDVLSKPRYSSLLVKQSEARQGSLTAAQLAAETVNRIMRDSPFEGQVTVEEFKGGRDMELYRAYDGIGGRLLNNFYAMTLGAFWCDRSLIENIWSATTKVAPAARQQAFLEFVRSAMFVHPEWNKVTDIACMSIPEGNWAPVVRGRGSWRALRSQPGQGPLTPNIQTSSDVINLLHWMPIPGPHQYLVPLFNDMWVSKVPTLRLSWPLRS